MATIEESTFINQPVGDVFAFVADQNNAPKWQKGLLEVRKTTAGAVGVGTKHTFVRKVMGRKLEASNEYTEYEPGKKVSFKSTSGPLQFEASYLTESSGEGTKLTSRIEFKKGSGLFWGLMLPLIVRSIKKDAEANIVRLKDLLDNKTRLTPEAVI